MPLSVRKVNTALDACAAALNVENEDTLERLNKAINVGESIEKELLLDKDPDEQYSALALDLILKSAMDAEKLSDTIVNTHKKLHVPISKLGKQMKTSMHAGLCELIKNEQDIETEPAPNSLANCLLIDYLNSVGYPQVAQTIAKEGGIQNRLVPENERKTDLDTVLKEKDVRPALAWLEYNAPEELRLRFDLHKQLIVERIKEAQIHYESNKDDPNFCPQKFVPCDFLNRLHDVPRVFLDQPAPRAVDDGEQEEEEKYEPSTYQKELSEIIASMVLGENDARYRHLFSDLVWPALLARFSQVICDRDSFLEELTETGARAVAALGRLKTKTAGQKDHWFSQDELPCYVTTRQNVHNMFTCPILRQLCTEQNPPLRLNCGHVISRDAVTKLANSNRQLRLKCPYCPDEATSQDCKEVHL